MDLVLYARVLWRFKWITLLGFVSAVALAFLSYASVSSKGIHYRQAETWEAQTTLLISQRGFSFGRTVLPSTIPPASGDKAETVVPKFGDEGRLSGLAMLYARLATSDPVMQRILRGGPLNGNLYAAPVFTTNSSNAGTLPLLQISGFATSKGRAHAISLRGTSAFLEYLREQQVNAGIPVDQRVIVQVVNEPGKPILIAGRKKTMPILIFVTMLSLAIGLAFVLENLRPRVREAAQPTAMQELPSQTRRSA